MFNQLILIVLLITVIKTVSILSYSLTSQSRFEAQTGMTSLIVNKYIYPSLPYLTLQFNVPFQQPFSAPPVLFHSFNTMSFSVSASINFYSSAISNMTTSSFELTANIRYCDDCLTSYLKLSYFAYNPSKIATLKTDVLILSPSNYSTSSNIISAGLNATNTFVQCFFNTFSANSMSSVYDLNISCSAESQTNLKIDITYSGWVLASISIRYLVILGSEDIIQTFGKTVLASPSGPLQFNFQLSGKFFLVITGFKLPNGPIKINMDLDTLQLSADRNYRLVTYTYFVLKQQYCALTKLISIPHQNTVEFNFNITTISSAPIPTFDNLFANNSLVIGDSIKANLIEQITDQQVTLIFLTPTTNISIKIKLIITAQTIIYNAIQKTMDVSIINLQSDLNLNDFNVITPQFSKKNYEQTQTKGKIFIDYTKNAGTSFIVEMSDTMRDIDIQIVLCLSIVTQINTSALFSASALRVENLINADSATTMDWVSNNIDNKKTKYISAGIFELTFEYLPEVVTDPLVFGYTNSTSKFEVSFNLNLITVVSLEMDQETKEMKITMIHIPNTQSVQISQFTIGSGGPSLKSIQTNGDKVILISDGSNYIQNQTFEVIFTPKDNNFVATVSDVKHNLTFSSMSQEKGINTINISFNNPEGISDLSNFNFSLNLEGLSLSKVIAEDKIILTINYSASSSDLSIIITLNSNSSIIFNQLLNLPLTNSITFTYCLSDSSVIEKAKIIWIVSVVLDILYLIVFLLSVISSRKLLGIELMFLIQLAYYSLIPINVYCCPFNGLEGLKYASGATPVLQMLEQKSVASNYFSLGIASNFLTNVNVVFVLLLIIPFIYFPMKCKSDGSKDKYIKPCYLKYGKAMLLDVPLTLLLFSSFNIYTSAVVNFQAFGVSNISSFVVSLISVFFLPIAGVLFLAYRQHFNQYSCEFNVLDASPCFEKQTTVKIRRLYPFVLIWEMILIPILLSIQSLFSTGLYLVMFIEILITVYVAIVPLYSFRHANIRNFIHRGVSLSICILQVVTLNLKNDNISTESIVFWQPFCLLLLLIIGLGTSGAFAIYKSIEHWKSRNTIDIRLQQGIMQRPVDYIPRPKGPRTMKLSHPIHWYKQKKYPSDYDMFKTYFYQIKSQIQRRLEHFFDQIQSQNLYEQLGITKQTYSKFKEYAPNLKSNYVRKLFNNIANMCENLQKKPNITSIRQYMLQFDIHVLDNVKGNNQLRKRLDRLYIQNIMPKKPESELKAQRGPLIIFED